MIVIDLLTAFDTLLYVYHNMLLNKMEFIEFSRERTKWSKSYLSNKKYFL